MNQVYGCTDWSANETNRPLTDTQKKQVAYLERCNAQEGFRGWGWRYQLTCKTCRTREMYSTAGMVINAIERYHGGCQTWTDHLR